ncbi:MAG TPA: T9SS type A sorting domain-containing protein [Flavobacteriales bacterium]|nr:T9SS type A sorting domain-containing protein [Flavobacteriales bacterium]
MRQLVFLAILALCLPLSLPAQNTWERTFGPAVQRMTVSDAWELPDGSWGVAMVSVGAQLNPWSMTVINSWLALLDPTGETTLLEALDVGDDQSLAINDLEILDNGDILAIGATWEQNPVGNSKVAIHRFSQASGNSVMTLSPLPGDTLQFIGTISTLDDEGDLFILGVAQRTGTAFPNYLSLLRAQPDGLILADTIMQHGGALGLGHHALKGSDGLWRVSMDGNLPGGPFGFSSIHLFTPELHHEGGLAFTSLSGSGQPSPLDSIMRDGLYMSALAGDTLIVSGRFGLFTNGTRAALVRLAPDGTYAGMFLPRSTYPNDYIGLIQGHDITPENQVVFATVENFDPMNTYVGTIPSRIHIYRLDTLLNPECEYIVDGFDGNVCYYLNRIKATRDGGFLLMGSRRDLNTMEQPRAWIMKVDGSQCSPMGLTEETRPDPTMVYPNPGRDGFTLVLNGTHRGNMRLELYDAMGQLAIARPITQSMEFIDTEQLPPGMYLYRVSAAGGALIGGGRWVKQ